MLIILCKFSLPPVFQSHMRRNDSFRYFECIYSKLRCACMGEKCNLARIACKLGIYHFAISLSCGYSSSAGTNRSSCYLA